jgi:hypothetical protein
MSRMVTGLEGSTLARISMRREPADLETKGNLKANLLDRLKDSLLHRIAEEVVQARSAGKKARTSISKEARAVIDAVR